MIAAMTKTTIVPHGTAKGMRCRALVEERGEPDPERDPERRADQRGDHRLVPDHPARLAPGHADRAQHPELARALEDGQDERVHDPEEADDDREPEQDVEQVESVFRPCSWVLMNCCSVWIFASGNECEHARSARRCSPA